MKINKEQLVAHDLQEAASRLLATLDDAEKEYNAFWAKASDDLDVPPATALLTSVYKKEPKGESVRLFGASGPKGLFLYADKRPDGRFDVTGRYNIATVRAWVHKKMAEAAP